MGQVNNPEGIGGRGRNSLFNETISRKMIEYLDGCVDVTVKTAFGPKVTPKIPSLAGFARGKPYSKRSMEIWYKKFKLKDVNSIEELAFIRSYDAILEEQEDRLLNNGLGGTYNATITGLMMYNHGYAKKSEKELKISGSIGLFGMGHDALKKAEDDARLNAN